MKKLLVLGAALGLALVCLIRFDLVAKEPAVGPALPAEAVRVGPALPAEAVGGALREPQPGHGATGLLSAPAASQPAAIPAGKAGPTGAAASAGAAREPYAALSTGAGRTRFIYDGKAFGQWVAQLRTDLSPERRMEAIKALTAFGAHGYGKEAAEAIVAAMRDYHFDVGAVSIMDNSSARTGNSILQMKYAAMEAVTTRPGRSDDRPRIAPEDAVPVLISELKEGPPNGRLFAAAACYKIGAAAKSAIPALVELVENGKDPEVRIGALRAVARVENGGDTTASLIVEVAKGNDRRLAVFALETVAWDVFNSHGLGQSFLGATGPSGSPSVPDKLKPVMQILIEGLTDKDPQVRSAAGYRLGALGPAIKEFLPALVQVLEGTDREGRLEVLSLLRNVGAEAKVAVPALIRILEKRDPAEDPAVREAALSVLMDAGPEGKDIVPILIHILEGPARGERLLATYVLGNLGRDAKPALPALEKAQQAAQADDVVQGNGESVSGWALRTAIDCIKRELPPGHMPRGRSDAARGSRGPGVAPGGSRGAATGSRRGTINGKSATEKKAAEPGP
jgi:HEAT repeat protein